MNSVWQLQEAKSRLSELVDSARREGAQVITRHGKPVAVVMSAEAYSELRPRKKLVDVLRECPDSDFIVERLTDRPRALDL